MIRPASDYIVSSILRILCVGAGCLLLGAFATTGVQGQVTITESFTGTSAPGWVFGGSNYMPNLTAASGVDTPGNGWLRLTDNGTQRATYALLDEQMFSVNAQIQITFEYATWNGTGADGVTFFLVDGSVNANTFIPGAYGGSLGYAQLNNIGAGMPGGYLGFGLDDWGNYSSTLGGQHTGGLGSGLYPNRVAVRGPESSNYAFIGASNPLDGLSGGGQMDFPTYTTRPDQTGADYRSFRLTLDANNQLTVEMKFGASGSYITVFNTDLSVYDRPDTFKIGFTASTGDSTEIHEIRNTQVTMTPWQNTAFEWDDGGSGSSWSTGGNWVGDVVPPTNADILFGDAPTTGQSQTVTMNTNQQMRSLTFDTDMNYTVAGTGTLTLGDTAQPGLPSINVNDYNGEQAQHHINVDITLAEDLRINNYSYSTLCLNGTLDTGGNDIYAKGTGATNFNGAIVGSGDLFKSGSGITTINNNNTSWTGNVTINEGMVVVTSDGALGTTAGTTTVNDGASLAFRAPSSGGGVNYATTESVTIKGQGIYRGNEGYVGAIYNDGGNNSFAGNITLAANSAIGSRDGVLTLSGQITDGAYTYGLTKRGDGVVELTNATNNWNGTTTIAGGVLRISNDANALAGGFATDGYSGGNLVLNGGVLEIGVGTTFTRQLGTGQADRIQWVGDGGFSAYGADRTVTLKNYGGSPGGPLTWGAGDGFVGNGYALLLSSDYSNAMVTLTNVIYLGSGAREIRVANGTAAVDATISGYLTSTTGGGIVKTGDGTLNLSNTGIYMAYNGDTVIKGGALRGNIGPNSNLVLDGGVRELTGNFTGNLGTAAGQVRWAGSGGFGAVGADRTVTLNNDATTPLIWGTTANFVGSGGSLVLGSNSSDSTLIFNNTVDLGGADRTIQVLNGSAAIDARMDRVLSNGSLTVTGTGNLALRAANTLAGTLTVKSATTTLDSTGTLAAISGATVRDGGTLTLDNSVTNNTNRINNSATVSLNGGTLNFLGAAATSSETVGALTLAGGASTINVQINGANSSQLTFASLARNTGATANFTNAAGGGTLGAVAPTRE